MCKVVSYALTVLAITISSPSNANDELSGRTADPNNWTTPSGNYANTRFSRLDQINSSNVTELVLDWTSTKCVTRNQRRSPLVIDNIMYLHSGNGDVCALDLRNDRRQLWEHTFRRADGEQPGQVFTYGDRKIFVAQTGGTIEALDALSGRLLWKSLDTVDPSGQGASHATAMLVVNENLLVGITGQEGIPCRVDAYGIQDGKPAWRANVSDRMEEALVDPAHTRRTGDANASAAANRPSACSVGSQFAYDPELNLFYYAVDTTDVTRDGASTQNFTTIFARNPDTGVAGWIYQTHTSGDWNSQDINEMSLVDVTKRDAKKRALVHFNRSGAALTIDRGDGSELERKVFRQRAAGDVLGAKPAAYFLYNSYFYVPTNISCGGGDGSSPGLAPAADATPCTASSKLDAWNAEGGTSPWSTDENSVISSGALATAGGLIFYASAAGGLKAVDPVSGSLKQLHHLSSSRRHRTCRAGGRTAPGKGSDNLFPPPCWRLPAVCDVAASGSQEIPGRYPGRPSFARLRKGRFGASRQPTVLPHP